ncbi:MAG: 5-oxoprolinase subunit PxpA [Verrucomicrobiota bacterium]
MGRFLINCDLGENESDKQTEVLLDLVDAANICCGLHAGSASKTQRTIKLAAEKGVMIGAHPGLAGTGGRGQDLPEPDEFRTILSEQLQNFLTYADRYEAWVSYIKLHGSLYHAVEQNEAYAKIYLKLLQETGSGLGVFALSGGRFQERAKAEGIKVWEEAFADRGYQVDGSLVPRGQPGALLNKEESLLRLGQWLADQTIVSVESHHIQLAVETFCVHSDTVDSIQLLEEIRRLFN